MIKSIKLAHLNAQSLKNDFTEIRELLLSSSCDVVGVTETWLSPNDSDDLIYIPGYTIIRKDRITATWGGGVCIYIKNNLNFSTITVSNNSPAIEQLWIKLMFNNTKLIFGAVYRRHEYPYTEFLNSLEDSISLVTPISQEIVCVGDFNIDLLNLTDSITIKLLSVLDVMGYKQIIEEPTRITKTSSKLIDLILVNTDKNINCSGVKNVHGLSDHCFIYCDYPLDENISSKPFLYTYRDFSQFNYETFNADLHSLSLNTIFDLHNTNDKVNFLSTNILNLFNNHTSIKTVRISKSKAPWMTDNVKLMISLRNKALQKFKRTKNPAHWEYYKSLRNYTTFAIRQEKKAYINFQLNEHGPSTLWKDLKTANIYFKSQVATIHLSDVNKINKTFIDSAIPSIHIDNSDLLNLYNNSLLKEFPLKFTFSPVSDIDIMKTINTIKTNATGSDNLSIKMLKLCCPYLIPFITDIINSSINQSLFPEAWKTAQVIPLPKTKLPSDYKDLRPISILPCLSKVLEKIMAIQIRQYVNQHTILPETQSGFRPGYSCSTALLNITDDIFTAIDNNELSLVIMLDYSKAFDTIGHDILISILHHIGFSVSAVSLIQNYLTNRSQTVILNNCKSTSLPVTLGVPQGSILGPLLYVIYTFNLQTSLKNCNYHLYADDTQLQYNFNPNNLDNAIIAVNSDLNNLVLFSEKHGLRINTNKCYVMLFGRSKARDTYRDNIVIKIKDTILDMKENVKNLGLIVDQNLRFKEHISSILRKAYLNLKIIFQNRFSLTQKIKTILCETMVLSQFNYCDCVYGPSLDSADIKRIQLMQNSCLRLIYGIRKFEHISYKLKEIKWLNMANRRKLHSACLYHKIIVGRTPLYLFKKIKFRSDLHSVNIRNKNLITIPFHRTALFERSYSYDIANNYNSLPNFLKLFTYNKFKIHLHQILLQNQNSTI